MINDSSYILITYNVIYDLSILSDETAPLDHEMSRAGHGGPGPAAHLKFTNDVT